MTAPSGLVETEAARGAERAGHSSHPVRFGGRWLRHRHRRIRHHAGLLPDVASTYHVTIPQAGHVITAYALGVVIGAPIIAVLSARLRRKTLLLGLMTVFAIGNILSALALVELYGSALSHGPAAWGLFRGCGAGGGFARSGASEGARRWPRHAGADHRHADRHTDCHLPRPASELACRLHACRG